MESVDGLCIPVVGEADETAHVADHFGRADFFMIFDDDSGSFKVVENDFNHDSSSESVIEQLTSLHSLKKILVTRIGQKAKSECERLGITLHTVPLNTTVGDVLKCDHELVS